MQIARPRISEIRSRKKGLSRGFLSSGFISRHPTYILVPPPAPVDRHDRFGRRFFLSSDLADSNNSYVAIIPARSVEP